MNDIPKHKIWFQNIGKLHNIKTSVNIYWHVYMYINKTKPNHLCENIYTDNIYHQLSPGSIPLSAGIKSCLKIPHAHDKVPFSLDFSPPWPCSHPHSPNPINSLRSSALISILTVVSVPVSHLKEPRFPHYLDSSFWLCIAFLTHYSGIPDS